MFVLRIYHNEVGLFILNSMRIITALFAVHLLAKYITYWRKYEWFRLFTGKIAPENVNYYIFLSFFVPVVTLVLVTLGAVISQYTVNSFVLQAFLITLNYLLGSSVEHVLNLVRNNQGSP